MLNKIKNINALIRLILYLCLMLAFLGIENPDFSLIVIASLEEAWRSSLKNFPGLPHHSKEWFAMTVCD